MGRAFGALFGYIAVKYLAYAGWNILGVAWLRHPSGHPLSSGMKLGVVRLFIGLAAGIGIFIVGGVMHWDVWPNPFLQYLTVYAPVRWFEWGIMECLVVREGHSKIVQFLVGGDNRSRAWRVGGIVVSHLADLPMIISGDGFKEMLPVGRFLC